MFVRIQQKRVKAWRINGDVLRSLDFIALEKKKKNIDKINHSNDLFVILHYF